MPIDESQLQEFRTWILERGRTDGTADLYVEKLRLCGNDPRGLTHRLIAGTLAPNTLRNNLAALRAWALFQGDEKLQKRLADIRLPPGRRVRSKQPLELDDLKRLVKHLQGCRMRNNALRQVLLIMALRGLRCGDVLRLRRPEVQRSLDTGKLIYEGKGRKRIEINAEPIRKPLMALARIEDWDRVRDLISHAKNSKNIGRKVWRAARRTAKKVGITEMNPHRFRHTFATRYLDQLRGDPNAIVKLQKFMGWESMATAARYVDAVSQEELDTIGAGLISGLLE